MKYVPILFSTTMVQAILDGTKTQTRRVVKGEALDWIDNARFEPSFVAMKENKLSKAQIGDVFWVRETWAEVGNFACSEFANSEVIGYRTQDAVFYETKKPLDTFAWNWDKIKWKPSIFMPKDVCRIFLEVTNVRVEQLQDISVEDAKNEGIIGIYNKRPKNHNDCWLDYTHGHRGFESPIKSFFSLWESINGRESLDSNPWVWVYDFKVIDKPKHWPK